MPIAADVARGTRDARQNVVPHLIRVVAFGASLVALQGVPFVTQWVAGRVLGAAALGSIRVAEVVFAIVLLLGGLGQPTSALRGAASTADPIDRVGFVGGAALIAVTGSVVMATLGAATAGIAPWMERVPNTLVWLFLALPFSAFSRVVAAYFQAREQFLRCAAATTVPAIATVVAVAVGSRTSGLGGWTAGRVAGEIIPALVLLLVVRHEFGLPTRPQLVASLRFGAAMAFSLALDRLAGGIDSLVLASTAPDPRMLGRYGAASLLTQVAALPAAAVVGVLLPGLVSAARQPAHLAAAVRRTFPVFAGGCAAVGVSLLVAGPSLLNAWLGLGPAIGWTFLPALVVAACAGALSSYAGSVLIAAGRGGWAVIQSAVTAVASGALGIWLLPRYGLPGLAAATAIAAVVRLGIIAEMARRAMR